MQTNVAGKADSVKTG